MGMSFAVVWFSGVHVHNQLLDILKIPQNPQENTYAKFSLPVLLFDPCGEIWLRWIDHLTSVGRLL